MFPVCRDSRRYSSIPDQLLRVSVEKNVKQAAMESFISQNPRQDNGLPLAFHIYRCHGRTAILTCGIHNTMTCRDRSMAIIYERMCVYKQSLVFLGVHFFAYQLNELVSGSHCRSIHLESDIVRLYFYGGQRKLMRRRLQQAGFLQWPMGPKTT